MRFYFKKIFLIFIAINYINLSKEQNNLGSLQSDTIPTTILDSVIVNAYIRSKDATYLPDVQGINIFAGKKTNTVLLGNSAANLPQNLTRTAFAQIPGLTMWD